MLQKNKSIDYGGTWVFPGGIIDNEDYLTAEGLSGDDSMETAARVTAVRETGEEAGLTVDPQSLTPFAHWVTPKLKTRRYATWFFAADANHLSADVVIDNGEIVDAQWFNPFKALVAQAEGSVRLNGPSFVTLSELTRHATARQALLDYQSREVFYFKPKGLMTQTGVVTLYEGDSAYHANDTDESLIENSGEPLHRLYMSRKGAWRYIKSSQD